MKAVVDYDLDGLLEVTPYPDARKAPEGAVDVPGKLIADHQLAVVRLEQAEAAIRDHLNLQRQRAGSGQGNGAPSAP